MAGTAGPRAAARPWATGARWRGAAAGAVVALVALGLATACSASRRPAGDGGPADGGGVRVDGGCADDVDGDGFVARRCGGDDCDDADPGWFPSPAGVCAWRTLAFDFEGCDDGFAPGGEASSWACGAPRGTRIDRAADGERAWVTNPAGPRNDGEVSWLASPPMDFSDWRRDPVLRFDWTLVARQVAPPVDTPFVEVSVDGGDTWEPEASLRDVVVEAMHRVEETPTAARSSTLDHPATRLFDLRCGRAFWRTATVRLTTARGHGDVRVRFRAPGGDGDEGLGVDRVRVHERWADVGWADVHWVDGEPDGGGTGFYASFANLGNVGFAAGEVAVSMPEGAGPTPLPAFPPTPGIFEDTVLSRVLPVPLPEAPGVHRWLARVQAAGDDDPTNDAVRVGRFVPPTLEVGPGDVIVEDFEDGPGDWGQAWWVWGTPDGEVLSGAASGTGAWFTRLPEDRWVAGRNPWLFGWDLTLEGPRLALAPGIRTLRVRFRVRWDLADDEGTVDASTHMTGVGWDPDPRSDWRTHEYTVDIASRVPRPRHVTPRVAIESPRPFCGEGLAVDDVRIEIE